MQVEFQYNYVFDLVYHMLAHMKVDNPSDLYAEEYIERIRLEKKEQYPGFMPEDRKFFVNPFVELLEKEDAFYGDYFHKSTAVVGLLSV